MASVDQPASSSASGARTTRAPKSIAGKVLSHSPPRKRGSRALRRPDALSTWPGTERWARAQAGEEEGDDSDGRERARGADGVGEAPRHRAEERARHRRAESRCRAPRRAAPSAPLLETQASAPPRDRAREPLYEARNPESGRRCRRARRRSSRRREARARRRPRAWGRIAPPPGHPRSRRAVLLRRTRRRAARRPPWRGRTRRRTRAPAASASCTASHRRRSPSSRARAADACKPEYAARVAALIRTSRRSPTPPTRLGQAGRSLVPQRNAPSR